MLEGEKIWGASSKERAESAPLVEIGLKVSLMAIGVVEFSREGYKIIKDFA